MNMGCIKILWNRIKDTLFLSLNKFMCSGVFPKSLNSYFVSLIPRITFPKQIKDYMPISLINSSPKLFSKVLSTRLGSCIGDLVNDNHYGFTKSRQAAYSILLVSEVCHSIMSGRTKGLILKLDFKKAFDTVDWKFLFDFIGKMGFGSRWINWIQWLLNLSRFSVLVNGSPTKEFTPSRGLKQGDPLSPLLFNLVGEVLSKMLNKASIIGTFNGVELAGSQGAISHVQFADVTIIFVDNTLHSLEGIMNILHCFQFLSGLTFNFFKSHLYGMKQDSDLIFSRAEVLGCKVSSVRSCLGPERTLSYHCGVKACSKPNKWYQNFRL